MESSSPPPTQRSPLCKLLPPYPSTSTSCKANNYNNACRMVTRGMARPHLTPQSIKPNLSCPQNGPDLGKIAWGHLLGRTLASYQLRVRKRRNNRPTLDFKVPSMAGNNSKHLRRISIYNKPGAQLAYHRLFRTKPSPLKPELSACKQLHPRHSRLPSRTLPLRHLPRTPSMGVGSTLLRMEYSRIHKACRILGVQINPSAPQWGRRALLYPHHSTTRTLRLSSDKECMMCA